MEKLEITLLTEEAPIKPKSAEMPKTESYEGLRLISETAYSGPTSIKYWM